MARTAPVSIRFDADKLEFIMSREKLTSKQQVIDLLVNKYWWEHKLPIPTPKESPPLYLKEQFVINDLNEPDEHGCPYGGLRLRHHLCYWKPRQALLQRLQ